MVVKDWNNPVESVYIDLEVQKENTDKAWIVSKAITSVAALSMSILLSGITTKATAEEMRVADLNHILLAAAKQETITDALPLELSWIWGLDINNPDIARILEERTLGFEHFEPFLKQLSTMSEVDQAEIPDFLWWAGGANAAPSDDFINFIQDWRVPSSLIATILEEAWNNWADGWDIEDYDVVLTEIREQWDTANTWILEDLIQVAPNTTKLMPHNATQKIIIQLAKLEALKQEWEKLIAEWKELTDIESAARGASTAVDELRD